MNPANTLTKKDGPAETLRSGDWLGVFDHDFGTLYIHPKANTIFQALRAASDGKDGRKRSVREARQEMRTLESAMITIGQLAFHAGIPAHEIFLPPNTNVQPRGE